MRLSLKKVILSHQREVLTRVKHSLEYKKINLQIQCSRNYLFNTRKTIINRNINRSILEITVNIIKKIQAKSFLNFKFWTEIIEEENLKVRFVRKISSFYARGIDKNRSKDKDRSKEWPNQLKITTLIRTMSLVI